MAKTILLTGAMGSGKSTVLSLGYRALEAHWGPSATIDIDTIQRMVDPRQELGDDRRLLELAGWQTWLLAKSFLTNGFECVVIGSNGLHTPEEGLNDMVGFLLSVGEVYHVTLDPSVEEIQRRVAKRGGMDISADSLAEHVEWMRARYRDWTCRIDNTSMAPEETLTEIAQRIKRGDGRVTGPLAIG
jgi:predicted ABC-type ATPase